MRFLTKCRTYPNIYTTIKLYLIIYENKSLSKLDMQLIIKVIYFLKFKLEKFS